MNVYNFYNKLTELYPKELSCEWDNDGIMCSPDTKAEIKKALIALDATDNAVKYACENNFDLILTHHPMIFSKLKSVTDENFIGEKIITAIKNGISVISLHTRLDAGEDGVNDRLACALKLNNISVFGNDESPTLGRIGATDITDASLFCEMIKKELSAPMLRSYMCRPVSRVAVVGGSGGDFIECAKASGADTFVTGECHYNEALDACQSGINVIEAGHFETEFPVCNRLAELAHMIAGAKTLILPKEP